MTTSAKVLADSMGPEGDRLTTLEVTFPRFILAEFNTHRAFSRNSASSRAIPVQRILERVMNDSFIPRRFPINKPGMSADEYVEPGSEEYERCKRLWLTAKVDAVDIVGALLEANVHKQVANRLLEPFMWHTVIVSATEWDNFYNLRISEFAQPEIREAAEAMKAAMDASTPEPVDYGEWHLPLTDEDDWSELDTEGLVQCCVARCAAVSYDRHHDRNYEKEMDRYERLVSNGHLSPFEHAATPTSDSYRWANFHGWEQARWGVEREFWASRAG